MKRSDYFQVTWTTSQPTCRAQEYLRTQKYPAPKKIEFTLSGIHKKFGDMGKSSKMWGENPINRNISRSDRHNEVNGQRH